VLFKVDEYGYSFAKGALVFLGGKEDLEIDSEGRQSPRYIPDSCPVGEAVGMLKL
jgi:hypothetical protein